MHCERRGKRRRPAIPQFRVPEACIGFELPNGRKYDARDGIVDGWVAMDGLGLVGRISGVG